MCVRAHFGNTSNTHIHRPRKTSNTVRPSPFTHVQPCILCRRNGYRLTRNRPTIHRSVTPPSSALTCVYVHLEQCHPTPQQTHHDPTHSPNTTSSPGIRNTTVGHTSPHPLPRYPLGRTRRVRFDMALHHLRLQCLPLTPVHYSLESRSREANAMRNCSSENVYSSGLVASEYFFTPVRLRGLFHSDASATACTRLSLRETCSARSICSLFILAPLSNLHTCYKTATLVRPQTCHSSHTSQPHLRLHNFRQRSLRHQLRLNRPQL